MDEFAERLPLSIDRNYIVGLLINELLLQFPVYEQQGFAAYINEWRQYDVLKGTPVVVNTPTRRVAGVANGINAAGEFLLLDEQGMEQPFGYGEVSIR